MCAFSPGQSQLLDTDGTAAALIGSKCYSYVILTDGTNKAILTFYKDVAKTLPIWADEVLGADQARPHTFHAKAPLGNPKTTGVLYAELTVAAGAATAYILFD